MQPVSQAAWPPGRAGPAAAVTDADRISANKQFRDALRRQAVCRSAAARARRSSRSPKSSTAKDARALVNPLTNLGTVHYRLKDYPAAEKDYQRSVEILEKTAGTTDRQLLRPLQGLGASHFAEKRVRGCVGRA